MQERAKPNAVFMAFGTRGDVNPVAAIAGALAKARPYYSITLITHAANEALRQPLASLGVAFSPITSPPVLATTNFAEKNFITGQSQSGKNSGWKSMIDRQHRAECLNAVDKIFGSVSDNIGNFIVINFFALEGWHLAELYHVPCVVAAPYVVPYSAPATFERQFQSLHPLLYRRLQQALPGEVGWRDVMHWMWPLFTDRWTEWRLESLHLSACPLTVWSIHFECSFVLRLSTVHYLG
eukprot:c19547_g1_i1 orf=140-853(+)